MNHYRSIFFTVALLFFLSSHICHAQTAQEYNKMGEQKAANGDQKGAIADYKKAVELSPDYAPAYYNLAFTYQNLQDYKQAVEYYSKVIELDPKMYVAYYARAICEGELLNYKASLSDLNIYIEHKKPNNFLPYQFRGSAKRALGDFSGAIEDYTKAIALQPQALQSYVGRAISEFKLGHIEAGCKDMTFAGNEGYILAPNFLKMYNCKN